MKITNTPNINIQTNNKNNKELEKACQQFESIFVDMILKNMRKSTQGTDFMPKSNGQKIFEEMLDTKMSEKMSENQGMGLAQQMYKQLSKHRKISNK